MTVAVVGIIVSALLGVFAGALHLLRSDLKELRAESRADLQECRTENRAEHRETSTRIDRLEGKLDMLILALGRAGFLIDAHPPQPPSDPQG